MKADECQGSWHPTLEILTIKNYTRLCSICAAMCCKLKKIIPLLLVFCKNKFRGISWHRVFLCFKFWVHGSICATLFCKLFLKILLFKYIFRRYTLHLASHFLVLLLFIIWANCARFAFLCAVNNFEKC